MTKRFVDSVALLAQVLPISKFADCFVLNWHTVQTSDQAALEASHGPIDMRGVRRLFID